MIIYGKQPVFYALKRHLDQIERIYVAKRGVLEQTPIRVPKERIEFVDAKRAQALSRGGNHQGILVKMQPPEPTDFEVIKSGDFLLFCDTITDMGNLGALARTAYALGVDGVIFSGIASLKPAPLVRSSAGAMLDMPYCIRKDGKSALNELKQVGFTLFGAMLEGKEVKEVKVPKKRVLILGSEGEGLSNAIERRIDQKVTIKMKRPFDSLNVSAAGAILMEVLKDATA